MKKCTKIIFHIKSVKIAANKILNNKEIQDTVKYRIQEDELSQ